MTQPTRSEQLGESTAPGSRSPAIMAVVAVAVVLLSVLPVGGSSLGRRFFDSLRIARPTATTTPTAPVNARTLQGVIASIVADSTGVKRDEADQPVPTLAAAAAGASFHPFTLSARKDPPTFMVLGEASVGATVNRGLLATLMKEAGRPDVVLPASLNGAAFAINNPRGLRVQYGNCPAPPAATIANQVNGPPPPSTDNANCVILTEQPRAGSVIPKDLDTAAVLAIALELNGMSPNQAKQFQELFGWSGAAVLAPPRFVRSYDAVTVNGTRGILMTTGGRRGPTYALVWAKENLVFTLTGYGSPADAVALANSIS